MRTHLNVTLYVVYIACLVATAMLFIFHSRPQVDAICCIATLAVPTALFNILICSRNFALLGCPVVMLTVFAAT